MSGSVANLANYISALRGRYARQLASDIARLRAEYGNRLIDEALQLSRQSDVQSALSVTGQRVRSREQRENARLAAAVFQTKRHDT
jgi:hypothetical protein